MVGTTLTDRIHPPKNPGLIARALYHLFKWSPLRSVPFPSEIRAHRPALLVGDVIVSSALMGDRAAPNKLKILASLRAATLVGCVF